MTLDDMERTAEYLQRGAWGLRLFADNFAGADIKICGGLLDIEALCEIADSYSAGFYAALKMAKEVAK